MSKFKITIGDQTHEGERDDIAVPDGFVLQTDEESDNVVTSRLARQKKTLKSEHDSAVSALLADDDFFSKAATRRGIELNEEGLPDAKIDPEKLQRHQTAWKSEFLDPVLKERDELEAHVKTGRRGLLERDIFAASPDAGVKEDRLRTIFDDQMPEFVRSTADLFEFDKEQDAYFFRDGQGNPVYHNGKYAGPDKVLIELRKKDPNHDYFEDKRPHASGFGKPGSGAGNGQKVISKQTFEAGGVKLEDVAGGKVTIVD